MKHIKHWLATMAVLLCSVTANAHNFEVGGIYYNITSSTDLTVEVTSSDNEDDGYYNENITIPDVVTYNGKTYRVTSIGNYTFCASGKSFITLPASVTSIGQGAFANCDSLSITIPSNSQLTRIGREAFYASRLGPIYIPESVTLIETDAFLGCRLREVHISSIEAWCLITFGRFTSNPLHVAGNLYLNGELVTELIIPDGVGSIKDYAFYNCDCITEVYIPIINYVTSIGEYAFYNCSRLMYANIPWSVTSVGEYAFSNCVSLTSLSVSEGVASIGNRAFQDCVSLASVYIPASVTSIGECAFSGCYGIGEILVEEGNVVYDSRDNCNAIIETSSNSLITGCKFTVIPESVTSIGNYAFYNCRNLASITIPESLISIGEYAFSGFGSLASVVIPEKSKLTSIGNYAFDKCYNLTSFIIPESITSISDYTFSDCESLTSITIPEGVTIIGSGAFRGCSSLASVIIPEKSKLTSIGYSAFYDCESLTSITIPEGVTSIGASAFYKCSSLTAITIPEGVTTISSVAFSGCSGLTSIICEAVNPPTINYNTFDGVNKSIPLYVPRASISAYQAASDWKNFTNIQAIPAPENITLTIGQYGSGTYCSPYALDFSEVEGLKAYAATGYDSETGVVTLTRVMTAKAGMGLFVKGEPGDYVVPTLESTSFNTLNMLVGTLEDVIVNGTDGLYTNYKYAAPDGEPLFYQFADGSTQKAGRAYLQIPTSWLTTTAAKSISYRFDDGETTDIENSEITTPNSEFIYDLYGRRVENPVKGGVYIVKGKKIVY